MAANKTVAAIVEYFQRTYAMPQKSTESAKRNPTTKLMKLDGERLATGEAFYVTVKAHGGYSAAHDFTQAMKDESSSKPFRFLVSGPKTIYGRLTFDGLFLAQNPLGAIINAKAGEMNDETDAMLARLEKKLWSDEYDDLGQISATGLGGSAATRLITLTNPDDVYNFPKGAYIEGFADRNTAATAPRADKYQVTGVDPANGQIELTRTADASAGDLAASDYLFIRGDRLVTTGGLNFPGITAFIPSSDPGSSDSFLGVNRYRQGAYYSGWRLPYKGTIKQTVKFMFSKMGRYVNRPGANFTVCLSAGDWYRLENELEGEVLRDPQAMVTFGTEALLVRTQFGLVRCITIPVLRDGRMYAIDWSTWTLHHLKGLPHIIDDDGNVAQRLQPTSPTGNTTAGDGIEIRWRMWVHPMCDFPIANGTAPTV